MTTRFWTPPKIGRRFWLVALSLALLVAASNVFDERTYHATYTPSAEIHDWYQALRAAGYMPVWLIIGLCFLGHDLWKLPRSRASIGWWRRGVALVSAPLAAGGIAELLKLAIGRERPAPLVEGVRVYQGYVFKPWDPANGLWGGFGDGSNLGLPSSHAAVAIAGAFALGRVAPGSLWPAMVFGVGCCITRLLNGAHFLSDVMMGAAVGYALSWLIIRPADLPQDPGRGAPEPGAAPSR